MITSRSFGNLNWQVVQTDLPIVVISEMNIDEKIAYRQKQRVKKNFTVTDLLRNELENDFIFINDLKDDVQEVYYMTKNFPEKMKNSNKHFLVKELIAKFPNYKYEELLTIEEVKKYALTVKPKFKTLRSYFDYLLKEDRNAESYHESWLHRMNEQLRRQRK